jgi:hypothetical protein
MERRGIPHLAGVRGMKKTADPDFLYTAPPRFAYAAFCKESRMEFLDSARPHRKSGGKPDRCFRRVVSNWQSESDRGST